MSGSFPLVSFAESLRIIDMLGFRHVDLACFEGEPHIQPSAITADPNQMAEHVATLLRQYDLSCTDVFATFSGNPARALNDPSPAAWNQTQTDFQALLSFAQAIGAEGITILPGLTFNGESHEESLQRTIRSFVKLIDLAKPSGLRLSFEAHIGSVCPEPATALRILDTVPGLTLTFDPSHFWVQGYDWDSMRPLIEQTGHVQLRQASRTHVQSSSINGTLDIPLFLNALAQSHYKGGICTEYIYKDWEGCKNVDVLSETIILKDFLLEKSS